MEKFTMWCVCAFVMAVCVQPLQVAASTIVDLSHPLNEESIYWPGMPHYNRTDLARGMTEQGFWLAVGYYSSGEHGGTHIDAPIHFSKGGEDLSQIPLDKTIAPGVHIDARQEAAMDSSYALSLEKIKEWELRYGPIPPKAAVLVNFGWSSRWPDRRAYFNTEDVTNTSTFSFPYVSREVSRYLIDQRNMYMLGVDTASPDNPRDPTFPAHISVLSSGRLILENVLIPETLPSRGFTVHAVPVKVVRGTGVQTRIYAILDDWDTNSSSTTKNLSGYKLVAGLAVVMHGYFVTLSLIK